MISLNSFIQFTNLSGLHLITLITIELVWLWSVICIARERTDEPTDRIAWLMVVLFLNILGTVLYILFSPDEMTTSSSRKHPCEKPEKATSLHHAGEQ